MSRVRKGAPERTSRHDDLVAEILGDAKGFLGTVADLCSGSLPAWAPHVETERPCGRGFIDVLFSWEHAVDGNCSMGQSCSRPRRRHVIVEVKSNAEHWTEMCCGS
jgi:hypothetical protein